MMSEIKEAMLALNSSPITLIVAKITVTTTLGLIAARLAFRSRAAVRHALLSVVFGVLLALPVVSLVAPPVRIVVRTAAQARTVAIPLAGATGGLADVTAARAGVLDAPAVSRPWSLSTSAWLLIGWIGGVILLLLPMLLGLRQVRSLRRAGVAWPRGQSLAEGLAKESGIRRRVEVLLHPALPGPMTCGVVHPAIVLPLDARNWKAEDLDRAIVHELEHVQRRDWVSQCVARAICAVYWFHPLVWIAWRQFTVEAERACDDAVLGRSEATAYADQLVGLAERLSAKSPVLAMANRADLATRVGAVLDRRQRRGRAGVFPVALACSAAAVLVLTISPLRMVAAPQAVGAEVRSSVVPALALAVSPIKVVAAPQAAGASARAAAVPRFTSTTTSTTKLVIVNAVVTDPNGSSIEGLSPQDFTVSEDGVAQTISVFEFQKVADAAPGAADSPSSYYVLGYYPRNMDESGEYRKIQVSLKQYAGATLRHRTGYYGNRAFAGGAVPSVADNGTAVDPSAPVLIRKVEPEYSEEARKAKWQGTSTLSVDVDESGRVTAAYVIRALGLGLDEKAVQAVRQWQFRPATKDGTPIAVRVEVEVSFRLL